MPDIKIKPPKAIVIVGASRDRSKFGNKAVRAYKDSGTEVFAINPFADEIEGAKAYKSVAEVPAAKTDLASVYTQPKITKKILPELAKYGIKEIFFNPGSETDELISETRKLGMDPLLACSVTAIGRSPTDYSDE